MAGKRKFSTFSLSFLDIMSCGFGAVVLVFLIIKHDVNTQVEEQNLELQAEVNLLDEEVTEGQAQLVKIKNTLSLLDQELVEASGLARRINDEIDAIANKIAVLDQESDDQQIIKMKEQLRTLMLKKKKLEDEQAQGNDARRFIGQGERQYLTGLKLGGARTLILLDVSASMLDSHIVNIIRRKNMSDESKKQSKKWQRAIRAVEWLVAKFPLSSQYQLYVFNTQTRALLADTTHEWLAIADEEKLNTNITALHELVPGGGTSLENAFRAVSFLDPLPDNIVLLTDGLPTQGLKAPKGHTVSGQEREELFNLAVETLPEGIPVNVLLWPMEGDPMAASAFWKLAQHSLGSFMSPSKDWP
ncbi:VWA domain-containing protein [Thalassomonas actiniarum]|uniref:VWA domain-containing protein n=1 Tax=Thalassomonas actiniarum TaxID=485447 RepID=A0AAE9YVS2_9GAMM|nr:vWA domain-containing protein [Thalassomonas actiniarum]WDE00452.1 VWA domain-containing protein [Thalassomonas actiniarum]